MKEIISNNKGKNIMGYAKGIAAALQHRRLICFPNIAREFHVPIMLYYFQ